MSGFESLLMGRLLADRYRVEEVIGRGGMGVVYRATDERLGRRVAVKVITATGGGDHEARDRLRARFDREARAAANLPHHPNVVPVYDSGADATLGLDFIVMELLRGEDLASALARSGPPPLGTSLRILQAAARGVSVGHRAGLIHRDVKPGNVFLVEQRDGDEMQVRVLDFGIAKAVAEEDTFTALTHDGRAPLSPAYASPEQLRGEARLTPASDVFSLGALGFQLLTGQRPFTEADRNRVAIGQEVPLPSLRARNAAVPEGVEAILRRAMETDPTRRFPDAGAMADALGRAIAALGDSPAAQAVPGAAPLAPAYDDDRTRGVGAADDDDRTMLAPPPAPPPRREAAPVAAGPAIPPPRRRQEERSGGGAKWIWLVLALLALGGAGVMLTQAMSDHENGPRPLDDLPDSIPAESAGVASGEVDPTDALAQDLEGRRALRSQQYDRALDHFRQAMETAPDNAEYKDHYALALLFLRRPREAVPYLEDAIRLNPNLDLAYSHLADAHLQLGDTTAAVTSLRRFLGTSVDQGSRAEAQRRLDALLAATQATPAPAPTDTVSATPTPEPAAPDSAPTDTLQPSAQPPR